VNDPFVALAERMLEATVGIRPGAYMVNVFPWCEACLQVDFSQLIYFYGIVRLM
jgi:hypothetical protein